MNGIPEYGVICCDSKDAVISWDSNAQLMFGWEHNLAIGKSFFALLFPRKREFTEQGQLRSLFLPYDEQESITLKIEDKARHQNGSILPVECLIARLPGSQFFTIFTQISGSTQLADRKDDIKSFQLEVINTILRMSLAPPLFIDRLTSILTYLTTVKEFNLSPAASLYLVEQDTNKLVRTITHGFAGEGPAKCEQVVFGHCYCGKAAQTNKLQYITSETNDHSTSHGHYCVPLAVRNNVIGVMNFYTPKNHQHSALTEETLDLAAQVIAVLIDNRKMDLQLTDLVDDLRTTITELREERNFSESIIQGLQHGLIVTDQYGNIQKYNDASGAIFNWFTEGLNGKNLISLVGKKNRERILKHSSSDTAPEEAELLIRAENGNDLALHFSTISRPVLNSGEICRIISLTDVSRSRQARKEMEKMNRLSSVAEIASAVAHEVRNPLAGIKIMAQSIEENSGTENERIECSRRIIRQVDRLNELLTDFFSYARPIIPKKRETSLAHILSETNPLIINKLEKHRIYLIVNFQDNLPPVIADPNQLQQVFLNLFLNAIDAIKQEGTIEIVARKLNKDERSIYRKTNHLLQQGIPHVIVHFKDNGAGMSQNGADRVFEPFFTTKTNGSGLGMSIVYRTLKENDATISVESSEGKGTTFTMILKAGT